MAACRPAGDFIGHFPSLPSPAHARPARQSASQPPVKKGESRQIHNLLYDVIPSSKDITTNLYGGKYKQYGGVCPVLDVSRLLLYGVTTTTSHFPDDGSMSSSRKLIHTTTIPIPAASLAQTYHISYPGFRLDFLLPSSGKQQITSP